MTNKSPSGALFLRMLLFDKDATKRILLESNFRHSWKDNDPISLITTKVTLEKFCDWWMMAKMKRSSNHDLTSRFVSHCLLSLA